MSQGGCKKWEYAQIANIYTDIVFVLLQQDVWVKIVEVLILSKRCRGGKNWYPLGGTAPASLEKWRETAAGKSANQAILADSAPLSQYEIILVTIDCSFVKWCEECWINPLSHITTSFQEQLTHLNEALVNYCQQRCETLLVPCVQIMCGAFAKI